MFVAVLYFLGFTNIKQVCVSSSYKKIMTDTSRLVSYFKNW